MILTLHGGPCDEQKIEWRGTPPEKVDRAIFQAQQRTMEAPASLSKITLARYVLDRKEKKAHYVFERWL